MLDPKACCFTSPFSRNLSLPTYHRAAIGGAERQFLISRSPLTASRGARGPLNRVFSNQRWARLRGQVLGTVLMATGAGLAASQRS